MKKISAWLQKQKAAKFQRYMTRVRNASRADKERFVEHCLYKAYYPLSLAMTTLKAPNFVEGTIMEQTTGELYHIELRKIKKEEQK